MNAHSPAGQESGLRWLGEVLPLHLPCLDGGWSGWVTANGTMACGVYLVLRGGTRNKVFYAVLCFKEHMVLLPAHRL